MADEEQMVPGFDWRAAWPFTHLFRSFRIAIHPSKLVLGLALLLTVYSGGRLLDSLWPASHRAVVGEIVLFQLDNTQAEFEQDRAVATGNEGPFRELFNYEANQFNGVVRSVLANEWIETTDVPGVPGHLYNFVVVGPLWLVLMHTVFAILFAILLLAAWSLFGGAIARLAAVQVARDEKVTLRQSLNFATGKFLSFASAPIIPLLIVLVVGFLLALCSLLGSIPYIGPMIVGGGFFIALLAGFVQTLVILGAVGGFNLMYPTIAVEGSDSFDAISRSFSYVYARPWRMLFYTAVAVAYGAVTYLFVRLFILLMLILAHHFVGLGMFQHDLNGNPLLTTMWPSPADHGRLSYSTNYSALNWGQAVGAGMLSFWIYLLIGTLGAFAISFYFSANTVIYFLMRRELDTTGLDDVYLEQTEEDFGSMDEEQDVTFVETVVETTSPEPPPSGPSENSPQ
jgi:hypothetical protein